MAITKDDRYYKCAFFSAYTTIPKFENPEIFFNTDIQEIFRSYKKALDQMTRMSNSMSSKKITKSALSSKCVYNPIPYCLLGDFDFAVFSLIDDFSFASKKFKPYSTERNFKYQVNTGIIPLIDLYKKTNSRLKEFQNEVLLDFFSGAEFYPFTGITSIKLNNSMLIGIGQEFIDLMNFYFVSEIDKYIEEKKENDKGFKMCYIINENLGWNEVTINFFGNTISAIDEISIYLKKNKLKEIFTKLGKLKDGFDTNKIRSKTRSVKKNLTNNSLLSALIKKKRNILLDLFESHPVIASSTIFGYHIENLKLVQRKGFSNSFKPFSNKAEFQVYNQELNQQCISISWNIKPGHEMNINNILKKIFYPHSETDKLEESLFQNLQAGKYSFVFPNKPITILEYLKFLSIANSIYKDDIISNVIKFKSTLISQHFITYNEFENSKHYKYDLNVYQIGQKSFDIIRSNLRTLTVPHIIKSQIENLIFNFNDAISDPFMYNYFIGLKAPLLKYLKEKLNIYSLDEEYNIAKKGIREPSKEYDSLSIVPIKINPEENITYLNVSDIVGFIKTWNKAYWNRYFHSYYFTEINDFNIEHHGGIQQILFSYDLAYKIISKRIYGDSTRSPFINVRIAHIITSSKYSNTINFTHLFRPAVYACECVHEAANHIVEYLIVNCRHTEFSFLFNPRKDIVDEKIKKSSIDFEYGLKQKLGSKDSYEEEFIETYFGINAIRYLFTDYVSFMLSYNLDPEKGKIPINQKTKLINNLKMYYHSQWFLYLTRSDLFSQSKNDGSGSWYFESEGFKFLFIRLNLMFYLMFDFKKPILKRINLACPSVELSILWNTQKDFLIDFVCRLGEALKEEFSSMKSYLTDTSIHKFKSIIDSEILNKDNFNKEEKKLYEEIIKMNHKLIIVFHDLFKSNSNNYYNSIIRNSENKKKDSIETNVSFYKPHDNKRQLFLDPKGNVFSTTETKRKEILKNNILYIKNLWDVSMKNSTIYYFDANI